MPADGIQIHGRGCDTASSATRQKESRRPRETDRTMRAPAMERAHRFANRKAKIEHKNPASRTNKTSNQPYGIFFPSFLLILTGNILPRPLSHLMIVQAADARSHSPQALSGVDFPIALMPP